MAGESAVGLPGARADDADVEGEVDVVDRPCGGGVYIVAGTFRGLTGDGSVHGPGTFLHLAVGTSHSPSTATGGVLFVYYPEG